MSGHAKTRDRMNAITTNERLTASRLIGWNKRAAHGFTLVELLVVVTIIGILAAVVLGAVQAARQSGRHAKTKSTITKLNVAVMEQYESYRTRRVPIDTRGLSPKLAAAFRLRAIREIMRMEMPERVSDIMYPSSTPPVLTDIDLPVTITIASVQRELYRPARARSFFRRLLRSPPGNSDYASAEYLYMMVSAVGAREQFHDNEIGDVDNDGWNEFVDGWGKPIKFLRWAPGFTESEIQTRTFEPNPSAPPPFAPDSTRVAEAAKDDHDPFDSRNIDDDAYRLVPLIYSAGPDGIYNIDRDSGLYPSHRSGQAYVFDGDPYQYASAANLSGAPIDAPTATEPANGSYDHYDNIHNHRLQSE